MTVTVTVKLDVDPDEDLDFVDVEDSVRDALQHRDALPPGVSVSDIQAEED